MYRLLIVAVVLNALIPIGLAAGDAEPEKAVAWARRAAEYAGRIAEPERRDQAFYRLTYCFARADAFDEALRCAEQVRAGKGGAQKRVYAFAFTAREAAGHDQVALADIALEQARQTGLGSDNLHAHSHVVTLLLEFDRVEEAIRYSASLKRNIHRSYTLNQVASHLASRGELEQALAVTEKHVPRAWREGSYSQIAVASAEAGFAQPAETVLRKISAQTMRDDPLVALAKLKQNTNDYAGARELARQVTDEHKRGALLAGITAQETSTLDDAVVEQRFVAAKDRETKVGLAEALVKRRIADKNLDEAADWIHEAVDAIESNPQPPQVTKFGRFGDAVRIASVRMLHLDLATAYHAEGDVERAIEHVETARRVLGNLDDSSGLGKVMLQSRLLTTIAKLELEDHFETARTSTTVEFLRPMALAAGAEKLVEEGRIEKALAAAEEIKPKTGTGVTIADLIVALVEREAIDPALQLLARLEASSDIGYAYEAFGRTLYTENESELDAALQDVGADAARAHICIGVASQLASDREAGAEDR